MEVIYMAHRISGDVERNLRKAKSWRRRLQLEYQHACIIAPWIEELHVFDENDPEHRANGLARCAEVVGRCDALFVIGVEFSAGINREIASAMKAKIPVYTVVERGIGAAKFGLLIRPAYEPERNRR